MGGPRRGCGATSAGDHLVPHHAPALVHQLVCGHQLRDRQLALGACEGHALIFVLVLVLDGRLGVGPGDVEGVQHNPLDVVDVLRGVEVQLPLQELQEVVPQRLPGFEGNMQRGKCLGRLGLLPIAPPPLCDLVHDLLRNSAALLIGFRGGVLHSACCNVCHSGNGPECWTQLLHGTFKVVQLRPELILQFSRNLLHLLRHRVCLDLLVPLVVAQAVVPAKADVLPEELGVQHAIGILEPTILQRLANGPQVHGPRDNL
mmetsp:Transcript_88202/g.278975  ORF Transcript_88202/g.278975 Transcript_88202/m.278975 type:complete len:259 (-) Transcript_88202:137-913(-)